MVMSESTTAQKPEEKWIGPASDKTLLGHPMGLFVLFFAEMWERFSYYGMRGLLKLYMVNFLFITLRQGRQGAGYTEVGSSDGILGWSFIRSLLPTADIHNPQLIASCITPKIDSLTHGNAAHDIAPMALEMARQVAEQTCAASGQSSVLYGWYTGLVYLTPFFGGMLADRFLGQRRAVMVGGVLMAIGHFVMAFENWFFCALLFLIIGNGCFKPNISTQVGNLYPPGDRRRDGAFTIFYMGINLGAFLCNLVCGTLAAVMGWHWGFAAAGVGMMIGLTVYLFGQKLLSPDTRDRRLMAAAETAPTVLGESQGLREPAQVLARENREASPLTKEEWQRVGALVLLCALNVVFWAVYEQQGNTMQTWADEKTVWPVVFGFQIPATWFQSINPFMIFVFAPLLDMFWSWQNRNGKEPSSVAKMAMGCIIVGLSFVVMIVGAKVVGDGRGSLFWPVFCTLLLTIGELYLSPIGLSLVTKVSPARIVSMMMGMWFLSSFFGNTLSGYIGTLYTTLSKDSFFLVLTVLGVVAGLAMWAFNKPLKRAMGSQTS
jgi:proton-dependent oligopeptide transporter, POT family